MDDKYRDPYNNLAVAYAATHQLDLAIETLQKNYPKCWEKILTANNSRPPMYLRVNDRQTTRSDYLAELEKIGIKATETPFSEAGIKLIKAMDVEDLPLFTKGHISVQDLAAQLAYPLLDIQPGQRVLDACAAPGGKLAHILEQSPGLSEVVAVEYNEKSIV